MDNSTPDMNELLVQYLDGDLQGADKDNLEKQLAADAALQQQFDSLQLTRESIRYYGLREKVARVHQQMMEEMQPSVKKINSGRRMFRYVASVAASLFLIIGGYLAFNFFTLSADKVYSANYQKFELGTARDGGDAEAALEKAYRNGGYKEVIQLHDAATALTVKEEFLCGAAAMELKDDAKAIASFTKVIQRNGQGNTKVLNDEAEYYLALAYTRNGDYDAALDLMKRIKADPAHTYNKKITAKLLRQIKMLRWR